MAPARRSVLLLVPFLIAGAAAAQNRGAAPAAGRAPRRQPPREAEASLERDERLARPITLARGRIYLGDLLERISTETGVPLEASERVAPITGYHVGVVVKERPAWQVLDGIARLYNFPPDRWFWVRDRSGGRDRYVLKNTLHPSETGRITDRVLEDAMVQQFRDRAEKQRQSGRPPTGLDLFTSGLSEANLRAIFRGQKLAVPLERLSPEQRQYLNESIDRHNEIRRSNPQVQQGLIPYEALTLDPGTEVVLERQNGFGAPPSVGLRAGTLSFSSGSWSSIEALKTWSMRAWLQEGEEATLPQRPEASPKPEVARPGPAFGGLSGRADRQVLRMAQDLKIDLIFDLPPDPTPGLGPSPFLMLPTGTDLSILAGKRQMEGILWKRRGDLYLFRPSEWKANRRDVAVPWTVIRTLRESARRGEGYLGLDDWILLSRLTREQRLGLAQEFGEAGIHGHVERLANLLAVAARLSPEQRAALAEPQGLKWEQLPQLPRAMLLQAHGPEVAPRLRILLAFERPAGRSPAVRYFLGPEEQFGRPMTESLVRWRDPDAPPPGQPVPGAPGPTR